MKMMKMIIKMRIKRVLMKLKWQIMDLKGDVTNLENMDIKELIAKNKRNDMFRLWETRRHSYKLQK